MKLNEISDNPGATKNRMRVGRGIGSGKGKTAGRGVKGQKSRTGVSINGFEGGQMAIYRRLPKRGFNNISRRDYVAINLDLLQAAVEAGKIAAGDKLDAAALVAKGVIRRARDGVRLLARGELKVALTLEVSGASEAAKAAVEQAGGSVVLAAAAAPAEG